MRFQIQSKEDAARATSYFNHFHDGFLETVFLRVVPEDPYGFGFGLPVRYEATATLMHSNYPAAGELGSPKRRIEMRMSGISKLTVGDLVPISTMLQSLDIQVATDGSIHVDIGGDGLVIFVCNALTIEEAE